MGFSYNCEDKANCSTNVFREKPVMEGRSDGRHRCATTTVESGTVEIPLLKGLRNRKQLPCRSQHCKGFDIDLAPVTCASEGNFSLCQDATGADAVIMTKLVLHKITPCM
jgi:hypothetical protein